VRMFLLVSLLAATVFAAPPQTATDELVACVDLRKKVDAFVWQYNPFKNPGDAAAVERIFGQWPRAISLGHAVVTLPGCYADVELTAAGQVAGIVYHAGDPLAVVDKPDPRPELRLALDRLKGSIARMQTEITWIESQLEAEMPPPAAGKKAAPGPKINGDYESSKPAKPPAKAKSTKQ